LSRVVPCKQHSRLQCSRGDGSRGALFWPVCLFNVAASPAIERSSAESIRAQPQIESAKSPHEA
jgi:hypothetical protein